MINDPLFTVWNSTELQRDLALMDRVKEKFSIGSDRELAEWLGVNKGVISEIRRYSKMVDQGESDGTEPPRSLTALQRLRAFDRLGYAWARDALMTAFPDMVKNDLLKIDNERARAKMQEISGKGFSGSSGAADTSKPTACHSQSSTRISC